MGGGASSSAAVTQENETIVINKSAIDILNKSVNTTAVDTLITNVKNCSSSIINNQRIVFRRFNAAEDININVSQNQSAWMDLSCAQRDEVKNEVMAKMVDTINQSLQSTAQQDVISKLNADSSAKAEQGWLSTPWGGASSDSTVNQKIKTYVENNRKTDIKNVIETAVYANFTNSNYDECIGKIVNSQEIVAEDLTAGRNILFTADQVQATQLLTQCIQEANVTSRAVNDVARFLEIQIKEDVKQSAESDAEGSAESVAITQGLPPWSASMSSICVIVIVIIGAILLYKIFFSGGGGGSQGQGQGQYDTYTPTTQYPSMQGYTPVSSYQAPPYQPAPSWSPPSYQQFFGQ